MKEFLERKVTFRFKEVLGFVVCWVGFGVFATLFVCMLFSVSFSEKQIQDTNEVNQEYIRNIGEKDPNENIRIIYKSDKSLKNIHEMYLKKIFKDNNYLED